MPARFTFNIRPRIHQAKHLIRICQVPEHAKALGQIIHILSQTPQDNNNSNPEHKLSELVDLIFQYSTYADTLLDIIKGNVRLTIPIPMHK